MLRADADVGKSTRGSHRASGPALWLRKPFAKPASRRLFLIFGVFPTRFISYNRERTRMHDDLQGVFGKAEDGGLHPAQLKLELERKKREVGK